MLQTALEERWKNHCPTLARLGREEPGQPRDNLLQLTPSGPGGPPVTSPDGWQTRGACWPGMEATVESTPGGPPPTRGFGETGMLERQHILCALGGPVSGSGGPRLTSGPHGSLRPHPASLSCPGLCFPFPGPCSHHHPGLRPRQGCGLQDLPSWPPGEIVGAAG